MNEGKSLSQEMLDICKNIVNEMPQLISDIPPGFRKKFEREIEAIIKKADLKVTPEKFREFEVTDNYVILVYRPQGFDKSPTGYYIIIDRRTDQLAGAARFVKYKGDIAGRSLILIPKLIHKFSSASDIKMMITLYSYVSSEWGWYLMSDTTQTKYSKATWLKWFNDPKKYGISDIFGYDLKTKKVRKGDPEKNWGDADKYTNFVALAKWDKLITTYK